MVDPGPEAVKESPPWRAMRPRTRRLQCGGLSAAGSDMLLPSLAKVWKKTIEKMFDFFMFWKKEIGDSFRKILKD